MDSDILCAIAGAILKVPSDCVISEAQLEKKRDHQSGYTNVSIEQLYNFTQISGLVGSQSDNGVGMQLTISTLECQSFFIYCEPNDTIEDVKIKVKQGIGRFL